MKKTVIVGLLFGFLGTALAQTIENAPGVSDPVKLNLVGNYSGRYENDYYNLGYTFTERIFRDGSKGVEYGNKIVELVKVEGTALGASSTFGYNLYSKNGSIVSFQTITQNTYLRMISIFRQASGTKDANGNICSVAVEIDRATLKLTKVTPSCDDLE